jgi:hypothetical protein
MADYTKVILAIKTGASDRNRTYDKRFTNSSPGVSTNAITLKMVLPGCMARAVSCVEYLTVSSYIIMFVSYPLAN